MEYTKALSAFGGSASDLARVLGLPVSTVMSWAESGEVPPLRQIHIQIATGGRIVGGRIKADTDVFAARKHRRK